MDYQNWTDEKLAATVRHGDGEERNAAFEVLYKRYESEVARIANVSGDLYSWHDEIISNTWLGVYRTLRIGDPVTDFVRLVRRVVSNQRNEAIRKSISERSRRAVIYSDDIQDIPQIESDEESNTSIWKQLQFVRWSATIDNLLSECEKTVWVLRSQLGYSHEVVGRLMGESVDEVHNLYKRAKRRVSRYLAGKDYQIDHVLGELRDREPLLLQRPRGIMLERNDHHIVPSLTEEELRPLGLTVSDMQQYRVSLLFTRDHFDWISETKVLYLLLTRKKERTLDELIRYAERLKEEHPWELYQDNFLFGWAIPSWHISNAPEEHVLKVEVRDRNIALKLEGTVKLVPGVHSSMINDSRHTRFAEKHGVNIVFPLSMHSPLQSLSRSIIPVSIFAGARVHMNFTTGKVQGVDSLENYFSTENPRIK